jgi:hypothetical protein
MYWTLQNLKGSESRQQILHYSSIFSAATVHSHSFGLSGCRCVLPKRGGLGDICNCNLLRTDLSIHVRRQGAEDTLKT